MNKWETDNKNNNTSYNKEKRQRKSKGAINNEQSRGTGNIGNKTHNEDAIKKKPTKNTLQKTEKMSNMNLH